MSLLQEIEQHGLADCEYNRKLTGGKTMKYYLGNIDERNGDMEYSDKYLFSTKGSAEKYAKKVTKNWRNSSSDDWDRNQQGYWSDCSLIFEGGHREIPKEDFDVLQKYIPVL